MILQVVDEMFVRVASYEWNSTILLPYFFKSIQANWEQLFIPVFVCSSYPRWKVVGFKTNELVPGRPHVILLHANRAVSKPFVHLYESNNIAFTSSMIEDEFKKPELMHQWPFSEVLSMIAKYLSGKCRVNFESEFKQGPCVDVSYSKADPKGCCGVWVMHVAEMIVKGIEIPINPNPNEVIQKSKSPKAHHFVKIKRDKFVKRISKELSACLKPKRSCCEETNCTMQLYWKPCQDLNERLLNRQNGSWPPFEVDEIPLISYENDSLSSAFVNEAAITDTLSRWDHIFNLLDENKNVKKQFIKNVLTRCTRDMRSFREELTSTINQVTQHRKKELLKLMKEREELVKQTINQISTQAKYDAAIALETYMNEQAVMFLSRDHNIRDENSILLPTERFSWINLLQFGKMDYFWKEAFDMTYGYIPSWELYYKQSLARWKILDQRVKDEYRKTRSRDSMNIGKRVKQFHFPQPLHCLHVYTFL
jgi:hypothetical protein